MNRAPVQTSLKELPSAQPIYVLPEDDLVGEVLIPCLGSATSYDCLTAFFHSNALKELAPGLAEFLSRPIGRMRLAISPLLSHDDHEAIKKGALEEPTVLAKRLSELYGSAKVDQSSLVKHTLECLAFLISTHRIEIKMVLVKDGLFHPKIRIFSDGENQIVVHGSNNLTQAGLISNYEQVTVSKSWGEADQRVITGRLVKEFDAVWQGKKSERLLVFNLPEALKQQIVREYSSANPPSPEDFWEALAQDRGMDVTETRPRVVRPSRAKTFEIPDGLNYERGDFEHQGRAIAAWENSGRQGILEMATGSGKTVTALIAAHRLLQETRSLLMVVAAPYLPLVAQWAKEAERFGLTPVLPGGETRKAEKLARVQAAVRNLRLGISKVECLVATHDLLCDTVFQAEIAKYKGPALLIADEVHNLGTPGFINAPPDGFGYRLGLSATPIRQYDQQGTDDLLQYFGDIVFRFTLEDAIGRCLVPYSYYLHPVELTPDEIDEWMELTARLRKLGWKASDNEDDKKPDVEIQKLLNRRRRILEQASGKVALLAQLVRDGDLQQVRHTLVYVSDKGREQLTAVNRLLMNTLKLRVHQVTQEETGEPNLTQELLDSFAAGDGIQVLTAMRVLDEGVDIPEVDTAYILASTTVERQWVQRRGRVLRKCARTNKECATIHDFLVIPPSDVDPDTFGPDVVKLLKGELTRAMAFAQTSRNAASPNGALATVRPIIARYF
ncbi:MAG: DEAD/DEAH box helicase family protein [Chloroflexi bacterium]|nr:DEAD/DEAH box helicase family protein [Chloroflexota bacterium]